LLVLLLVVLRLKGPRVGIPPVQLSTVFTAMAACAERSINVPSSRAIPSAKAVSGEKIGWDSGVLDLIAQNIFCRAVFGCPGQSMAEDSLSDDGGTALRLGRHSGNGPMISHSPGIRFPSTP